MPAGGERWSLIYLLFLAFCFCFCPFGLFRAYIQAVMRVVVNHPGVVALAAPGFCLHCNFILAFAAFHLPERHAIDFDFSDSHVGSV